MLAEGAALLSEASEDPARPSSDRRTLRMAVVVLSDASLTPEERLAAGFGAEVADVVERQPIRELVTVSERFPLLVERDLAGRGAWYEFFPRSEGAVRNHATGEWTSGNFRTAAKRLDAVAGHGLRRHLHAAHPPDRRPAPQGPEQHADRRPARSRFAVGHRRQGRRTRRHPPGPRHLRGLRRLRGAGRRTGPGSGPGPGPAGGAGPPLGAESNPEWFTTRVDGSIAYAENPPKKYQDIFPLNFDNDPEGLSKEILRIVLLWVSHGVKIFRVDNPHTKPVWFWEWLIAKVNKKHPEVVFLAEAFTRPAMMHALGRAGFQQSYTYFTWRNTKKELEEYFQEVSHESPAYFRPNFFVNTPDILTEYLQFGGPAAFKIRAALAATASPLWGVYAGYELYEHVARPGAEEYIDNEKFEYKARDWDAAAESGRTLAPYLTRLNEIRHAHPALGDLQNLTLHHSTDDATVVYSKHKTLPDGTKDTLIIVVQRGPARHPGEHRFPGPRRSGTRPRGPDAQRRLPWWMIC